MATATDLALGTVLLAGDIAGSSNANTPRLTPTGVTPGVYKGASVFVDAKGRVVYARGLSAYDIPCATAENCGKVSVTTNHHIDLVDGSISIKKASHDEFGVVMLGEGFTKDCCEIMVDYVEATPNNMGVVIVPTSGNLVIDGSGNISVPIATSTTIGLVKATNGNGLTLTDGLLEYTPPEATTGVKGYAQIGSGFVVAAGQLSIPTASSSAAGVFRFNDDFDFTSNTFSYTNIATASTVGLVKIGSGLAVEEDGTLYRGTGTASTSIKGMVQVDASNGLTVAAGLLAWAPSNTSTSVKGVVQVGANMLVSGGEISLPLASGTATKGIVGVGASGKLAITEGVIDFGPVVAVLDRVNVWSAAQVVSPSVTSSLSGSTALNMSFSNTFDLTLTGNSTLQPPSNMVGGGQYIIIIRQDAVGSRTITFPPAWTFLDANGNASMGKAIGSAPSSITVVSVTALDNANAICHINRNFA